MQSPGPRETLSQFPGDKLLVPFEKLNPRPVDSCREDFGHGVSKNSLVKYLSALYQLKL